MIDEQVPYRIQRIYASATDKEKYYLRKILQEIADTGDSQTYRDIWLSDYVEIPVDIETFLCDDYYLGKTTRNGQAIYPFWKDFMVKLFHAGNKYEEVFFTGATRIGKSSTAITCTAYMLYKLMCLRDPQKYFEKKDVSVFSILFFNLTKDLASGVGYREFQDTVLSCPWFLNHGKRMGSDKNPYYLPDGGKVTIDYGSDAAHGLGKQVFCVVGSTKIKTRKGYIPISELEGQVVDLAQFSGQHVAYEASRVLKTKEVHFTRKLTFSNGYTFESTPDHMIQVDHEGSYIEIQHIHVGDVVVSTRLDHELEVVKTQWMFHIKPIPVYDVIDARPFHNFVCEGGVIAHNCGFLDELNFSRAGVKDISKAKAHMKDLYNTISARVKGTFRMNGEVYGKIFAVSSKRGDSDFMEAYMQEQIQAGAGDHMLIADAPQWEVLPKSMFSEGKFYIAVGDRHKKGFVVPDNQTHPEAIEDLKKQGYSILTPPIDMKPEFTADFDIALRDLAGISVVGALSFITQEALTACINQNRRSPFYSDIVQTGMKDSLTIEEFFHINEVPPELKRMPMFLHLDLSINTDKTGIGGICISGRKDQLDEGTGKVMSLPTFTHVFSISIEAPRGDRIPYSKIVSFIKWLRDKGFYIAGISRDTFQSEYLGQLLTEQGFEVKTLSLDRTADGYIALRSVLLEQRIDMLDHQLLQDELIHLQRDANTGRVDHPIGGCFTGDTKIRLADDRVFTIEQLLDIYKIDNCCVYSVNEQNLEVEVRRILNVFVSKHVDNILELVLSNGGVIRCTPEHRFLLSSGDYKEAQYLDDTDSLRTFEGEEVWVSYSNIIDYECDVYDLTIADNPNFLLDAGVFVHNSKDCADGFAGAVWNAILTNPPIPVPTKSVAQAMRNINTRGLYGNKNQLPAMFGRYRKM